MTAKISSGILPKIVWVLLDEEWLYGTLEHLAQSGYENDVGIMVAKLVRAMLNYESKKLAP